MSINAIVHLSKDQQLRKVIEAIPLPKRSPKQNVYASLIESIVSQQLSVKAAATIHGRFLDLFPERYPEPDELLNIEIENLRAAGLSRQKAGYIQNVAHFFNREQLIDRDWSKYSDEAIINDLTQIKGVGKWTVQMILMFTLNRPDVFPIDDLGIRNAMIRLYDLEVIAPKDRPGQRALYQQLEQIAEAWSPYRTLACRYLWKWMSV
jgi:DNA-3-methyladenine glycosylase II